MTIRELIAQLEKCDGDYLVVIDSDKDGEARFSSRCSVEFHEAVDIKRGRIGIAKLTPELEYVGYDESDVINDGTPAIVLWPST